MYTEKNFKIIKLNTKIKHNNIPVKRCHIEKIDVNWLLYTVKWGDKGLLDIFLKILFKYILKKICLR